MQNRDEYPIKAVPTTFEILESLHRSGPMDLTALADRCDLSKPGVFKHLKTLRLLGYVHKRDDAYDLTHRFLGVSLDRRSREPLYTVATSVADRLTSANECVTSIVFRERTDVVFLHQSVRNEDETTPVREGEYRTLANSVGGLAILEAFERTEGPDAPAIEEAQEPEMATTDTNIMNGRVVSFDRDQLYDGWHTVATSIKDAGDKPIAAIETSYTADEASAFDLEINMAGQLTKSADTIEERLHARHG
jgi:DNA-binding IclR family transcriptional regulator